jgi:hypothetical protein
MTYRFLLALLVTVILQGFQSVDVGAPAPQQILYVSVLQLIATPGQYNDKLICVIGFLKMGHEGDLLFLHEEDGKHVILENAVRVQGTEQMRKESEKLDNKYVKLTGVFQAGDRGKLPFFSGKIAEVRTCEFWSDPNNPISRKIRELPGVAK